MASIGKVKVQCRFCDSECVILLKSYHQHLRRKHNGVYLTTAERREDVVSGGENLRRPIPNGEQAASQRYEFRNSKRHASDSDNFIDCGGNGSPNDDEEAPRSPESASSNDGGASSSSTDDEFFEIEAILEHRFFRDQIQYLVKWEGYPNEESSWISPTWIVGPSAQVRFSYSLDLIFFEADGPRLPSFSGYRSGCR